MLEENKESSIKLEPNIEPEVVEGDIRVDATQSDK